MKFFNLLKKHRYKNVNIYVSKHKDLFMIPTGSSKKFGIAEINIVNELKSPYTDEGIEEKLLLTFDQCFTKNPDELINITPIELHFKIKGWTNAVRNKKLISCMWNDESGYVITPTNKVPYNGYEHQEDDSIVVGKKINLGDLANAVKIAIEKSKN
ncbi:hypothetical protein [Paenibacillus sp. MCAF9]|uniref:hypothetical protein n=1 Tax=Paenibacillus sp. MCAF9 TaxID=3233046 RepID=UPI003F9D4B20